MSLDTAIERFRRRQESLFRDECVVTRSAGEGTFDEETGLYGDAQAETIYEGPCQIRPAGGLVGTDVQAGDREWRLKDFVLKLPVNTPVTENDVARISASTYDADLTGRTYRITDVLRDGRQIARTCVVEEAT